ncbi:hypothetical protein AB0I94_21220 [Streptomyces sp. NPDC050147]|uniref:hypothetical protein n=1 Tax=Streptomyces sp. NPDC050147 TaxID=3155513 RepID=UPI003430DEB5
MPKIAPEPVPEASGEPPAGAPRSTCRRPAPRLSRRGDFPLLVACVAFAALSLALVPLTLSLGWDEIVYASRFPPYAPATPFSAPRTRGVPLLISPVAAWSDSTVLLRIWLTLLSTVALYLGFSPWLRVIARRPAVVGVAAGLYGSLWFTLFYANAAMPNHYTAMGVTAAVGLFLAARPGRLAHAGIAAGLALAALMRPNDGAAVAVPLLAAALLVPAWRTKGRVVAVAGGVLAGLLPWAVEAYVRFGGVRERLNAASEVQGGLRPLAAIEAQFTALDGPLLCRPCTADQLRIVAAGWWLLLPLLVAAGLWATGRSRGRREKAGDAPQDARNGAPGRPTDGTAEKTVGAPQGAAPHATPRATAPQAIRPALQLAVVVAVSVALPYLLLVPYGAPRFLLPAHALLAVPAALGLLALVDRGQRAVTVAVAVALVAHLGVQLPLALGNARIQAGARGDWVRVTGVLYEQGVRAPCLLKGSTSVIPIAYVSGCSAARQDDPRQPAALVLREKQPPRWARDWRRHPVPDTYAPGWTVLVPPTTTAAARNASPDMRS